MAVGPFDHCAVCFERFVVPIPWAAMMVHQQEGMCRAARRTFEFIKRGLRPFPVGHTLPFPRGAIERTRGAYEGEPRGLLDEVCEQEWFPLWVDVIVTLWVNAQDLEGDSLQGERAVVTPSQAQRDAVLRTITNQWSSKQKDALEVTFQLGGLRAVRELIKPIVHGPLPELEEETDRRFQRLKLNAR